MFRTLVLASLLALAACGNEKPHKFSPVELALAEKVKPYCGPVMSYRKDQLCNAFVIYKDGTITFMTAYSLKGGYASVTGRNKLYEYVYSTSSALLVYDLPYVERFVGPNDPEYAATNQRYLAQVPPKATTK